MTGQLVDSRICRSPSFEESLMQEIRAALKKIGNPEVDLLTVTIDGHDVVVKGWLPTFFIRQKVEFTIFNVPSVATLQSQIEVGSYTSRSQH